MYASLLEGHSFIRWAVVLLLLASLIRSGRGVALGLPYARLDKGLRTWLTTATHLQFLLGATLYFLSPTVSAFRRAGHGFEATFFAVLHPALMIAAVVVVTVAGSLAKRAETDPERHRTALRLLVVAAALILVAIPWPGSPLAARPLLR